MTLIGLHMQTKQIVDILGNIEILARMRLGKMSRVVTLVVHTFLCFEIFEDFMK